MNQHHMFNESFASNLSIIFNHHVPSHDTMNHDPRNHWFHFGTLQLSGCPKLPLLFIGWTPGRGSGSSHDLTKIYYRHHCNRFTTEKTQKKFKPYTWDMGTGMKIGTSGGFCTSTSWHSKRWSRQRCEAKLTAAHPTFEDCPGTPESILHELMKIVQMIKYTGKHMVNIW